MRAGVCACARVCVGFFFLHRTLVSGNKLLLNTRILSLRQTLYERVKLRNEFMMVEICDQVGTFCVFVFCLFFHLRPKADEHNVSVDRLIIYSVYFVYMHWHDLVTTKNKQT